LIHPETQLIEIIKADLAVTHAVEQMLFDSFGEA